MSPELPPSANAAALSALFGTSCGEVGRALGNSSQGASPTTAPKQDSDLSCSLPTGVAEAAPPYSLSVTAADLQELAEEGVMTEEVGRAVWQGLLSRYMARQGKGSDAGRPRRAKNDEKQGILDEAHELQEAEDDEDQRSSHRAAESATTAMGAAGSTAALNTLFGTSIGEVGALFSNSSDSVLSISPKQDCNQSRALPRGAMDTTQSCPLAVTSADLEEVGLLFGRSSDTASSKKAPQQDPMPALGSGIPLAAAKEEHTNEVLVEQEETPKFVVIDQFDELADFETIAATQGLTEADVQGEMTIIDASGKTFTWQTFSPAAQFPIKMQFTAQDADKLQAVKSAERRNVQHTDERKVAAAAKKRGRIGAAAKKKAAAAKSAGMMRR